MGDKGSRSSAGTRTGREEQRKTLASQGPPADESPLAVLIARLREQDGDFRAVDVADALWLADMVPGLPGLEAIAPTADRPVAPEPAAAERGGPGEPSETAAHGRDGADGAFPAAGRHASLSIPGEHRRTGPTAPGPAGGTTVRVPGASTLPDAAALLRALRPLRRPRSRDTGAARVLDEHATVDRAAESRLLLPVLRPVERHVYRIALLMDASSSNAVWQDTFAELRQIAERAGVFREVAHHYVHEDGYGQPALAQTFDPGAGSVRLVPPTRLVDPSRRCLVLVLSDCVGPLWRDGRMQRLLHRLAGSGPVAVMQPLPQRMWRRTHLPPEQGLLTRRPGPMGGLGFRPRSPGADPSHAGLLPVPVLPPHAEALEVWARLVADTAGFTAPGVAALVRADHPQATAVPTAESAVAPKERLLRFRRAASPPAIHLAALLSAVPLALPVMQLVQRAVLPDTGPEVMAEVLLSGLLRQIDEPMPYGGLRFEFLPGMREELLRRLPPVEAAQVLLHASEYVERHYGRGIRNFPALASTALSGAVAPERIHALGAEAPTAADLDGADRAATGAQDFARVSMQVLRHFTGVAVPATGPEAVSRIPAAALAARARDHVDDFRRLGVLRHLDAAVSDLGAAVQAETDAEERAGHYAELAEVLLMRWSIRPIGEHLRDALYAAQDAVPLVPSAQLTLTRVLERMADEAVAGRLRRELLPPWALTLMEAQRVDIRETPDEGRRIAAALLAAAVGHLPGPGTRTGADSELSRQFALVRIRVLRRLAVAGAPYARERPGTWCALHLQDALRTADVLVRNGPEDGDRLARGTVLFDLARHHSPAGLLPAAPGDDADLDACRAYAARAADDLGAAAQEPSWRSLAVEERCRAVLDHAHALVLARPEPDEEDLTEVLGLLDGARLLVEGPSDTVLPGRARLAVECRLSRARILSDWCVPAAGGRAQRQDAAIDAWTAVLPLLAGDDPRLPDVWAALGPLLTARGTRTGSVADRTAAVRMLRRAVEAPARQDAEAIRRRLELARSLLASADEPDRGTLSEADTVLRGAPADASQPGLDAEVWQLRGDIAVRAGTPESAAHCYGVAADRAWRAGPSRQWFDAALARAAVLDAAGEASSALRAYEQMEKALRDGAAGACATHESDEIGRRAARLRAACEGDGGDHA